MPNPEHGPPSETSARPRRERGRPPPSGATSWRGEAGPPGFRSESDIYPPVKAFLEGLGYEVKGEVRGCDVVAVRPGGPADEPPVVVELKLSFTLGFVLQGVDRLAVTDLVYLALPSRAAPPAAAAGPRARRAPYSPAHPGVRRLCRRLGLGLLAVHPPGGVEVVCDPGPPGRRGLPRRNKERAALLLGEHARRRGDPNRGGGPGGRPIVTAYRQEALRCAELLRRHGGGPVAVAAVRDGAAAPNAARILYRNVYGWFEPAGRGLYRLTEEGARGLEAFAAGLLTAEFPLEVGGCDQRDACATAGLGGKTTPFRAA